jgi:choloylglycine hydrolase
MFLRSASIILAAGLSAQAALACTGITLRPSDGTVISARSLEFGLNLDSALTFVPRGYRLTAQFADGSHGAVWTQKYAALGLNAFGQPFFGEGLNEAGLGAGAFYLPGFAEYAPPIPDRAERSLLSVHLVTWILGNCATVAETKERIHEIALVQGRLPQVPAEMPLHYRVTDATGAVLVIEYVDGGTLRLYDAPLGVITNSPTYDWHLTNLRNYTSLRPADVAQSRLGSLELSELGQGSGLRGLPGDFSPPARFVRAAALQAFARPAADARAGVNLALHILNNVDIPVGPVSDEHDGQTRYDRTEWVSVSDLTGRTFYFRTYDNMQLRRAALDSFDPQSAQVQTIPLEPAAWYQELGERPGGAGIR